MRRKHIVIGIPTLGIVSTRWAIAYGAISTPMNTIVARIVKQGLPVDEARNAIVATTLGLPGAPTHLMFIDDDVIVHPHALLQLLAADRDIVSGVYFSKSEASEPLIFAPPGEGVFEYMPGSGLHEVWGHGMGLTLIRTDVFRRMAGSLDLGTDRHGHLRWYYTSGDVPGEGLRCTEDLWFCSHAHDAGFACWVDMHPFVLGWHYDPHTQQGYPAAQWRQYLATGEVSFEVSPESMERHGLDRGETLRAAIDDEVLGRAMAAESDGR